MITSEINIYEPIQFKVAAPVINDKSLKHRFFIRLQWVNILTDLLVLDSSLLIWQEFIENGSLNSILINKECWFTLSIANIIWLCLGSYNNIYQWKEVVTTNSRLKNLIVSLFSYLAILTSVYLYVFSSFSSCDFILPALLTFSCIIVGLQLVYIMYLRQNMPPLKYLIVGGNAADIRMIKNNLKSTFGNKKECIGNIRWNKRSKRKQGVDIMLIKNFIKRRAFDKLYYFDSNLTKAELSSINELCQSFFIDFEVIPRIIKTPSAKIRLINQGGLSILTSSKDPLQHWYNAFFKRSFDVVFSLLVIIFLLSWLTPIIAFFIKKESDGPIFFIQKRTGLWNKTFKMIKFRSMVVNEDCNHLQAIKNDCRLTKIGGFMRKYNIDELPQFFNVLIGDMSVVGPRPHMLEHTIEYTHLIENYLIRHRSKPGITGLAQISGYRGPTDTLDKMQKRVEYDARYLTNWTFVTDIFCIVFTGINMIRGEENAI